MVRQPRLDIADEIYHVINRANARWRIFKTARDYGVILDSLEETLEKFPLDIFSFCIMPNHWHFSIRPHQNGDIGKFFGKFTQKVTQRWHVAHHTTGSGHLFQGRFKSFLVEQNSYFLQLMRYIEANPLRAKLVIRAEDWQWSSLYLRMHDLGRSQKLLAPWPIDIPKDYLKFVNQLLPKTNLDSIRRSVVRGNPLGSEVWVQQAVRKHGLDYTLRSPGRPKINE